MNKRPVLFRICFTVIVVAVFALSMYPLKPRNFLSIFDKKHISPEIGKEEIADYYDKNQDKYKDGGTVKPLDKVSGEITKALEEKNKKDFEAVLKLAKEKMAKDPSLFDSVAVEEAAKDLNVDLVKYYRFKNLNTNRDLVSEIRKQAAGSIRLGIDLNGGAEFILLLEEAAKGDDGDKDAKKGGDSFESYRDAAIEILRNRLESEKIFECEISPFGSDYISLKVPIVSKEEKLKLKKLIEMSAKLQFCLVSRENDRLVSEFTADPANFKCPAEYKMMETVDIKPGEKPRKLIYFVKRIPEMDGRDVDDARPAADEYGQRFISLSFNGKGASKFGQVTRDNVGRQLAIILDGTLYSAPTIQDAIEGGHAQITGSFTQDEVKHISTALISGSLPVKIKVEAVFDTDPTLGLEEIKTGTRSGILSLIATAVFALLYYRRAGLAATLALIINIVLILGSLAAFEATLTLPGIAGIILTIGMAVDANVLINERIREELANNKTLGVAIDSAYDRAFLTILDSNLTTLMTALILMWQGTGPIKGFAVTLTIGILTSMFTALFVTRLVFDIMGRITSYRTMDMMQFFAKPDFDFLKYKKPAVAVSIALLLVSFGGIAYKKGALGIDFTGGTRVTFSYDKRVSENEIVKVLAEAGLPAQKASYKTNIIETGENKKLEIVLLDKNVSNLDQGQLTPKDQIAKVLNSKFEGLKLHGGEETTLGRLIGIKFAQTAAFAIFLSIVGMIAYISLRFEFSYGVAAIIALIHDIIISAGIFVLLGGEFSLNVVAALLTVLGYSVNDTIIVFDRIREDLTLVKNKSYNSIINLSINQTLTRTVITSGTTLLVVVIMLLMAGLAIRDFLSVLCIGLIVGTYSSVFIASPIISLWHKKSAADKIS